MKELLDSDRANYLIWRYLLEGNYRETAAKFQKEWRVQQPHRHFDFAPHVKNYALVDVLNKGLVYQGLERDYANSQVPGDAPATAVTDEPRGVFGPLVPQPPINYDQLQDEEQEPLPPPEPAADNADKTQPQATSQPQQPQAQVQPETQSLSNAQSHQQPQSQLQPQLQSSLKRQVDAQAQLPNGTPAKRPRLGNGNGLENGNANGVDTATSPMAMDVDHQSDNHAYPSPLEGEQAPTPVPRTDGPDHATQIDKVEELGAKTIYLRLTNDEPATSVADTPTAEASHLRTHHNSRNPILLQCEWNPNDPTRLAAAGTDALARVWTVSRATGPDQQTQVADHVADREDPEWPSVNLINDITPSSQVISWSFDGKQIAVATNNENAARIDLCDAEGGALQHWEDFEYPVVKLRCNPLNRTFLSVSPSKTKNASSHPDGWVVTLFASLTATPVEYRLPGYDTLSDEPDVAWMNDTDFLVCVGTKLVQLKFAGDSITLVKDFTTRSDDSLTAVQYHSNQGSGYVAAATASGHIDVWNTAGERLPSSNDAPAHDGRISVLQWQPRQGSNPDSERLLASGGEDGIIAIRDARFPDNKPKFEMTIDDHNPVLALSFTPDGLFIAGATRDKLLVWKVGEYVMPRASWARTTQPGRLSPKVNGDADVEEDQHCLCWDAHGHRLAFGVNDLLAVINFR